MEERREQRRRQMLKNRKDRGKPSMEGLTTERGEKYQYAALMRSWERKGIKPTRPPGDGCDACERPYTKKAGPNLDHNHETHIFRGWLCKRCNTGMGLLGDSAASLRKAMAYLEKCEAGQQNQ